MNQNEKLQVLKNKVFSAEKVLEAAQKKLKEFEDLAENNKFSKLEVACNVIEGKLLYKAEQDCEGSYNCGLPEYIQKFYVNDKLYEGKLTVEYNRYDKTYYYVDESEFTYKEI